MNLEISFRRSRRYRVRVAAVLVMIGSLITREVRTQERADSTATRDTTAVELDPITVTVTRSEVNQRALPRAVSVLERDQILGGRLSAGLSESLRLVPGVLASNRYNPSLDERISIRGFGARSAFGVRGVRFLIDGIPQTLPDGQGQLTNLELWGVERVEAIRGVASSLYGNASGGVVSVITSTPDRRRPGFGARVTGGAFGWFKWQARTTVPWGSGAGSVLASRTTSDGFRDHSERDFRRLNLRVVQDLTPNTRLRVQALLADNPRAENPGSLTRAQVDSAPSIAAPANLAARAGKDVAQGQLGVSLQHALPGGSEFELAGFGLVRDLDNPLSFALIRLERQAYGARLQVDLPLATSRGRSTISFGTDFQRQRDERRNWNPDTSEVTLDQVEAIWELGPFVQLGWDLTDRVTASLGSRVDLVRFSARDLLLSNGDDSGERTMSAWSWSAGVIWRAAPHLQPFINLGTSFETPTTTELVNRPDGSGGFNEDLDPQRTLGVEAGARLGLGSSLELNLTLFHTEVTDQLIPFEVPQQPGRRFFRNAGSGHRTGLEVSAGGRPIDEFAWDLVYTHADFGFDEFRTEQSVFDGNELPGVPGDWLHLSARFSPGKLPWLALDLTHNSAFYVDDANTARNRAWTTLDLRAGWDLRRDSFSLAPFLGVMNLLDESYVGSVVVNARGGRYFEPAPGRNAYLGLEVRR